MTRGKRRPGFLRAGLGPPKHRTQTMKIHIPRTLSSLVALAATLLVAPVMAAAACPHDLTGTWVSDARVSMQHARRHARLAPKTDAFLAALFGHMTLSFGKGELRMRMPDIEAPVAGERKPLTGLEHHTPYRVLFCNASTVVWSARRPGASGLDATTAYFVGPDTFWIYLGNAERGLPDIHAREYYRRQR